MKETNLDNVQIVFDHIAQDYDEQRRKLIPCFDDFYGVPISVIDVNLDSPDVLDLGAGTGLFSFFLLKKFPNAQLTLIDIADKMLDIARNRFAGNPKVKFIVGNYSKYDFNKTFDIIISALSIHHLEDQQKANLYKKVFLMLRPGGLFINSDQVLGCTPDLDSLYKSLWKTSIEKSGFPKDEILAAYERTKLDKEATLQQQLHWLEEAGFSEVDCIYKHLNFAVMLGKKQ